MRSIRWPLGHGPCRRHRPASCRHPSAHPPRGRRRSAGSRAARRCRCPWSRGSSCGQQPSCSKFLYWIKAARYAGRARWRPKAADAPVYCPALGSPRQLSAQGQTSDPTSPPSNPTSPKQHHQANTTAAPHTATATRRTRPAARPRRIRGDTSQIAGQSKTGQRGTGRRGCGGTHGRCSPQRGSVVADFLWLRLSSCCRSDLEGWASNGSLDRVIAAGRGQGNRASWQLGVAKPTEMGCR